MEVGRFEKKVEGKPRKVVAVIDTTYFGRNFGVLVILDAHEREILYREIGRAHV